MPLPPAGQLRVRDVTHSTLNLDWDAAPGPVEKYLITYKPDNGDAKEVSSCCFQVLLSNPDREKKTPLYFVFVWRTSSAWALLEPSELMNDEFLCVFLTDPSTYWRGADNGDCSCLRGGGGTLGNDSESSETRNMVCWG